MRSPGINGEGELRGQPANPGSPGKNAVKTECVCLLHFNEVEEKSTQPSTHLKITTFVQPKQHIQNKHMDESYRYIFALQQTAETILPCQMVKCYHLLWTMLHHQVQHHPASNRVCLVWFIVV